MPLKLSSPIISMTTPPSLQSTEPHSSTAPFSLRLREGTKKAHRDAEHAPFIQDFFKGRVSITAYREYVHQLYFVYQALERAQENVHVRTALGPLHSSALHRCTALAEDLDFLYGHSGWDLLLPLPATKVYVEHIHALETQWPLGLVAHHYTRYLGDLSGGQVLKRIAAKAFGLEDGKGLAFYDFPDLPDHTAFKHAYRLHLDALPLAEAEMQELVNEANHAFYLNQSLFEELGKEALSS